ncbi:unnamed protein product [Protopolystoma xenopodis]|uniref:Uncharacterized protein n=1 Tax=Protopolystoma xenopodis TaxID=117903 RepID=A0A3S5B6Z4_9PLAT|nr:unnamed protein product [Protopolystoma xenopodis]
MRTNVTLVWVTVTRLIETIGRRFGPRKGRSQLKCCRRPGRLEIGLGLTVARAVRIKGSFTSTMRKHSNFTLYLGN